MPKADVLGNHEIHEISPQIPCRTDPGRILVLGLLFSGLGDRLGVRGRRAPGAGSLAPGLISPWGPWARSRPWGRGWGCRPPASEAGAAAGAAVGGGWGRGCRRGRGWGCRRGRGRDHRFQYGFLLRMACAAWISATDFERILVRGWHGFHGGFHCVCYFLNDFEDL